MEPASSRRNSAAWLRDNEASPLRHAGTNEPVFVLRGSDVSAGRTVEYWIFLAESIDVGNEKLALARAAADMIEFYDTKSVPGWKRTVDEDPIVRTASQEIDDPNSIINRAADDEPCFVLRATDPTAPAVIRFWAFSARNQSASPTKVKNALAAAELLETWATKKRPD